MNYKNNIYVTKWNEHMFFHNYIHMYIYNIYLKHHYWCMMTYVTLSDWLLFNANSAIFQLYHSENKLIFNKMMMRSALYSTNMLSWIFIVLAHWNNSLRIDISPHSDTLFWFHANQSTDRHVTPLWHIILIPWQPVYR